MDKEWARVSAAREIALHTATAEQLTQLKALTDDDLLRAAGSLDAFAIVEANRRLKNALIAEETAIKRLTIALVVLTVVLVIFGVMDITHKFAA